METTTDRPGPFTGIGTTSEIETAVGEAIRQDDRSSRCP